MKISHYLFLIVLLISCSENHEIQDLSQSDSQKQQSISDLEKQTIDDFYGIKSAEVLEEEKTLSSLIPALSRSSSGNSSWMANIDDDMYLSNINIPGTHESCALYGGSIARCQYDNLTSQLENGIRCFDIRVRHINNCFMIHHGAVYQWQSFSDVMDSFKKFLKNHPTETIVMNLKEENNAWNNSRSFFQTAEWYSSMYKDCLFLKPGKVKLKDVRNKVVLYRRFDNERNIEFGSKLYFKDNSTSKNYIHFYHWVQDEYNVKTIFNRWHKFEQVKALLEKAKSENDKSCYYFNFLSGSSAFCYPNSVAEVVNKEVLSYLRKGNTKERLGWLYLDFATANQDLINFIINSNQFKLSGYKVTATACSSEETSSENGRKQNACDGNINTIWHSEYSRPHGLPQNIVFDLGTIKTISGVKLTNRQPYANANGRPKRISISQSKDGVNWTSTNLGTFANKLSINHSSYSGDVWPLPNVATPFIINFSTTISARYLRLNIKETQYNVNFTYIANFEVF